jgi:hypothetical protein
LRRKALQELANALCPMSVGARISPDLSILADLPDGTIEVDLLRATAHHSTAGPIDLHLPGELSSWLQERLASLSIPREAIRTARVSATYQTDRLPTNRDKIVSFDWRCNSALATDEKEYQGSLLESHTWHHRGTT